MGRAATMPKRGKVGWRWAMGNKRQKKKVRRLMESCGCSYCCPEDNRERVRRRDLDRDRRDEGW